MSDSVVVVVLAGGLSTRMGSPKADVVIAGDSMRGHILTAIATAGLDAIQIGGAGGIPDRRPGPAGPLAGLETGLMAAAGRDVIVVAVDHPWLLPGTLSALAAETGDAVVPVDGGIRQVTCARYSTGCLGAAGRLLDAGRGSVQGLLDEIDPILVSDEVWRMWGEDGRSWFSADTEAAIVAGLRAFGPPGTLRP